MRRFKIPSVQFPKLLPKGLSPLCILLNKVLIAQLCLVLCDPMDCSPPGCSVHGILPARILEWVAMSFSRGSSQSRDCLLHCRQILYCLSYPGSPEHHIGACCNRLLVHSRTSLLAQMVKNLPAIQETWVPSLGQEDPLEKGMAIYSSILACGVS